jgi:hypothetical protein
MWIFAIRLRTLEIPPYGYYIAPKSGLSQKMSMRKSHFTKWLDYYGKFLETTASFVDQVQL